MVCRGRVENTVDCHSAGIMDLDIKADLLVTCGLSKTHSYTLPSPIRY